VENDRKGAERCRKGAERCRKGVECAGKISEVKQKPVKGLGDMWVLSRHVTHSSSVTSSMWTELPWLDCY